MATNDFAHRLLGHQQGALPKWFAYITELFIVFLYFIYFMRILVFLVASPVILYVASTYSTSVLVYTSAAIIALGHYLWKLDDLHYLATSTQNRASPRKHKIHEEEE